MSMAMASATSAAAADHFAVLTDSDLSDIIDNVNAKSTQVATARAAKLLKDYIQVQKELKRDWFVNLADYETLEEQTNFEEMGVSSLDAVLEKFFSEVRQQNGQFYKMTSFYALRYGINRHIATWRQKRNLPALNILNPEICPMSNTMFKAMGKKLKKEGKGGIQNHPPIEQDDMTKISSYFEANIHNNPSVLQEKVFFDLMLHFGRRGRENLRSMKVTDFAVTHDAKGDMYLYSVHDEATKNHQMDLKIREGRMWEVKESLVCPVRNYTKYVRHLNPECSSFFQRPKIIAGKDVWYENIAVGENTLGKLMSRISEKAGCSKTYSNHSLRATCVHLLDEANTPGHHITSVTNHRSESSLKTYTGYTTEQRRKEMSCVLSAAYVPSTSDSGSTSTNVTPTSDSGSTSTNVTPATSVPDLPDLGLIDDFDGMLNNTLSTTINHSQQSIVQPAALNFYNCNVTINYGK